MARQAPWARIGTKNETQATTAVGLMSQAGLDWRVNLEEIETTSGLQINDRFATVKVNGDDSTVLSVVGSRYNVIQNAEVFSCLDDVVGSGEARYAAAGELGGGKVVWTVLALPQDVNVGSDPHNAFILARSSHDGSTPFQITPIVQRLNCTNQINLMMFKGRATQQYYSIRHTTNSTINVNDVRLALNVVRENMNEYVDVSNWLVSQKMNDQEFSNFSKVVYPLSAKIEFSSDDLLSASEKRMRTAVLRNRQRAMTVWIGDTDTQHNIYGTKFGAFQAIVEVSDHYAKSKDKQAEKSLLGKDIVVKQRALELLTKV